MRRIKAKSMMCTLSQRLNELSLLLEKLKLADYLKHLNNVKRMLWINFLGGVGQGFWSSGGIYASGRDCFIYTAKNIFK